jgi:twitching motility two-component system response regulator PilG
VEVADPEVSYPDPQAETVAFYLEPESENAPDTEQAHEENSAPEWVIPMPASDFSPAAEFHSVAEPPHEVEDHDVSVAKIDSANCPFCGSENEHQVVSCQTCMAVLSLSNLESLLANQSADKLILRQTVEDMERRRASRPFDSDEMTVLGLGHLNLRNLQLGYSCLSEASRLSPNNVVLSAQVNALLIRLEEIKQQEEAHLKMPRGKSILVVDDSPTVRKLIAGKLEKSGHDVICAVDGVEAMEQLETMVPDLILLDIAMPRMDGYQVCKLIRSNNATKDVAVVMISGKDGFFDKVRGRMAGTTGYITKPFGPETLMKAVEMYLSGEVPDQDEV